jgi:hypothetical protein
VIGRTLRVAAWLAAGAAVLAALYWLFLNTPESNALMLTISALLALLLVAASAVVVNVALLLAVGHAFLASLRTGVGRIGWFLVVAAPAGLLVWAIMLGDTWVARRSGEISAWFIAQFGWADVTPLFTAISYLSIWLRWVLIPVAALAVLTSLVERETTRRRWRAMWDWRTLLPATIAFAVLVALPWRGAYWRPEGLPPTWVEPAAAGLRLALVAALIALGFAIIVVTTAGRTVQVVTHVKE